MKVGCVKEIKNNEFRVGMTPDNVKSYVNAGHDVYIEKGAGEGSGFLDAEYVAAGAKMIDTAKEVWDTVEMMIKVKEPLPEEYPLFHEGLILYTYLHLAADKPQTDALLGAKVKGVAYETLIERNGSIPLLAPMSQIAGRLSIQEGAKYLEMMSDDNSGEDLAVAYDSQEQVYTQMLKELEEADKVLEENKDLSSEAFRKLEDLYYGNITKWRRFVHSMQLRIAMRMSYVKPAEAQRVAEAAVAAGVIESNDDNAALHKKFIFRQRFQ